MANTHIVTFIQSLSPSEIKTVEEYLNTIQPLFNKENNELKELKLFQFLIANKSITLIDSDIEKAIGTKDLRHLKRNLYDKVLEAFLFDKHITNTNLFTEYDITTFTLKKRLLLFKILFRSSNDGKAQALYELLTEIIDTAKEFEVYDVLAEALTAKKYFTGIRLGANEFEKINDEIDFYNYCTNAVFKANDFYYRLILNNDFVKLLTEKELDNHILSSIKQMEKDYKKTKSQRINYYLHILRFALSERKKDYSQAIIQCNQLLQLLNKNKIIYRAERIGFALTNSALFKIFIGNYEAAVVDTKKAQEYYLENSFNFLISIEHEFYANFYNKNYAAAEVCIDTMLHHSLSDTGEFRKSKFIYYQACVKFSLGQFKEAHKLLTESLEIEKDKTRWNISLRILNIMSFIELDKINEASTSLESLRKHIERTGKADEVKQRDVLIVKLLREIEKNGFMYDSKNTKVEELLKDLSAKDKPTSWEHYSPELIPFHEWVITKK